MKVQPLDLAIGGKIHYRDRQRKLVFAIMRDFELQRTEVKDLDDILGHPFPVLDHGFIRVVDYMGDDGSIVQAARVSYGKGTKKVQEDRGLIRYLMRHRHTTPFEMCEIKFHVKMPIFVARQWIRHRTANVNEYSARYSILDNEFYIPDHKHLSSQSTQNKQGRDDKPLDPVYAQSIQNMLFESSESCYRKYEDMLQGDGQSDIARELARIILPVNFYTQMYWKIDLHNLLHFLALRSDSHAQQEIQDYAKVMLDIVQKWVPLTYEAFMDYKVHSAPISGPALALIRHMVKGQSLPSSTSGISPREMRELADLLQIQIEE